MPGKKRDTINTEVLAIKVRPDVKAKLVYIAKKRYRCPTLAVYLRTILERLVEQHEAKHGKIPEEKLRLTKRRKRS